MKRTLFSLLLLVSIAACGPKRPPVVTGTQGGVRPPASPTTQPPPESIDTGSGINPVDDGSLSGSDLSDPITGEGGPLADIHFEYDSAELTDAARATLQQHAQWIKSHRAAKVTVEGHCDERGTTEYNLALGDQRARATREYLVSLGVDASALNAVSFGKERPIDTSSGEAAWAKNRRAHFAVSR
jgi:peptidoglycan-associated lipoprotein